MLILIEPDVYMERELEFQNILVAFRLIEYIQMGPLNGHNSSQCSSNFKPALEYIAFMYIFTKRNEIYNNLLMNPFKEFLNQIKQFKN